MPNDAINRQSPASYRWRRTWFRLRKDMNNIRYAVWIKPKMYIKFMDGEYQGVPELHGRALLDNRKNALPCTLAQAMWMRLWDATLRGASNGKA